MNTIKRLETHLESIIEEQGMVMGMVALANAIRTVSEVREELYADMHPDYPEGFEETEEYKNLWLAEQVIAVCSEAFDINTETADKTKREMLLKNLHVLVYALLKVIQTGASERFITACQDALYDPRN